MGAPEIQVPLINALTREVDIRGIFRYANEWVIFPRCEKFLCKIYVPKLAYSPTDYSYEDALELVASGKVNVKPLITHNYKLEETVEAFETTKLGRDGAIKVMIHC